MKRSSIGRVDLLDLRINQPDLLDLLRHQPDVRARALTKLLGYEYQEKKKTKQVIQSPPVESSTEPAETQTIEIVQRPLYDAVFWYVAEFQALPVDEAGRKRIDQAVELPEPIVIEAPVFEYLTTWAELEPRLRATLAHIKDSHQLDIPKIVEQLGRARIPTILPYAQRSGWGDSLQVIDDRNKHLAPYLIDHEMVQQQLPLLFPGNALEIAILDAAFDEPMIQLAEEGLRAYRPPVGGRVLILSDLGCLAQDAGRTRQIWRRLGQRLRAEKCEAVVLLPCSPRQCGPELGQLFHLISWEHPAPPMLNPAQNEAACERLLQLLAPTWRFSPGMLRAVRLALGADAPPASLESYLWQHQATQDLNLTVSALKPEEGDRRHAEFAVQTQELQARVLEKIRVWHYDLPREIWCSTLWNLPNEAQVHASAEELHKAKLFLAHIANRSREDSDNPLKANARAWVERNLARLSDSARNDPELKEPIRELRQSLWRWQQQTTGEAVMHERLRVSQRGKQLCITPHIQSETVLGSPLFDLSSGTGELILETSPDDQAEDFWQSGKPPSWVNAWGEDEYGPWVEFLFKEIRQRLRWVPPGEFLMGSPDNEPGRWEDEGPRHSVNLSQGYWLFDTPVTQALWQAVMGDNPSRFKSPDRPVERVSWDDCQEFLKKINEQIPGLELSLPSEAQWEHACRAGSETAIYTGGIEILGDANAPALDPVAWYGGNSGVGFELSEGEKIDYLSDRQFDQNPSGTHPVGLKQPNAWGLYDILGNVWEWTADTWHDNYAGAPEDGSVWDGDEAGAERVVRGGSWSYEARDCRSACRYGDVPGIRSLHLGFRPARVQVSQAGQEGAQPAAPGVAAQAQPADQREWRGGAVELVLPTDRQPVVQDIPDAGRLILRTDQEILTLQRRTKPSWASAMGRDRFGLWAEIIFQASEGPVRQRLRWIPPGRFQMGSPEDEPGRHDWEGPQHEVLIQQGYWLFDTPVTQALWLAVMGDNPSEFQSPERPVEKVSWDGSQRFLQQFNSVIPELELSLPSEAQWEYACRAGSETAIYTGEINIIGESNAPALDPIAWYGGNSGEGFELDNGLDSSDWPEKQYPSDRSGTHPVGLKSPNPWGLYDMLGNVWEWTADAWHDSYEGAPEKGSVWDDGDAGAERVIRGGSWGNEARFCRSACRDRVGPADRDFILGFRPARVQP